MECVPNFSEGRNTASVDAIEGAISCVHGAFVLHRTATPIIIAA